MSLTKDVVGYGWIGIDLDGTLAFYDGWKGVEHIGDPIPEMAERVRTWLNEGKDVRIFTARACMKQFMRPIAIAAIERWCETHFGKVLPITSVKDFGMIELWDDRSVQVVPNTGRTVEQIQNDALLQRATSAEAVLATVENKAQEYKSWAAKAVKENETLRETITKLEFLLDELTRQPGSLRGRIKKLEAERKYILERLNHIASESAITHGFFQSKGCPVCFDLVVRLGGKHHEKCELNKLIKELEAENQALKAEKTNQEITDFIQKTIEKKGGES